jgi:hypothetical protein
MSRWLARLDELRGSSEIPSVPVAPGVQNVQTVQNPPALGTFEHIEHIERIERAQASAEQSAFEERAAIVEFDAGVPREWAEGFARICTGPRPAAIPPARWRELVDNATLTFRRTPPTPGEHVAAIWELCIEAGGESHG